MQTTEFIDRVETSEDVANRDVAETLSLATIEALCIHLPAEEVRRMSSQLPRELSIAASKGVQQGVNPELGVKLEDFYREVAVRADMDTDEVKAPVRAVINVFNHAITAGEFADVAFRMPADINTLLAS